VTAVAAAAKHWLAGRVQAAPASLVDHMNLAVDAVPAEAVAGSGGAAVARLLTRASLSCLAEALESCDDRTAALPLLAADALITAACEAAAGVPGALEEVLALTAPDVLDGLTPQ
jgi:hypothetical protein